ncbi:MAG: undecaprenyl-phosphate glucose phosphotransferase [Sphingomonadaceae bacterium]
MKRLFALAFGLFLLASDLVLLFGSFVMAYNLRLNMEPRAAITMPPLVAYQELVMLIAVGVIGAMLAARLYVPQRGVSRIDLFYSVLLSVTFGNLLALGASTILFKGIDYPRWVMIYCWAIATLLLWTSRMLLNGLVSILRSLGINQERLLIVGADEPGQIIYDRIANWPGLGYTVIGFLEDDPTVIPPGNTPVLGPTSCLPQVVTEYRIDEVVFASSSLSHKQILHLVHTCGKMKINVKVFPDAFQIMSSEVAVAELGGLPLLRVRDVSLRWWHQAIKRTMDLTISAVALVLFSPLLMLTALVIKLTSPNGPVFFSQVRVGLDGKPFELLKFRSMVPDAEKESGPVWAKPGDKRTTRFGRFMRRYSIDELPQLINVLIGEMSLVGPRPERPYFVEQFSQIIPRYAERHNEKAGMTGWAQVNGLRGNTSIEERTKYDLYYVENWSPLFDIKILLRTLFAVFKGGNAY